MAQSDWADTVEAKGHKLRRDEDGSIDWFDTSDGFHNGPSCEICHGSWCHHCTAAEKVGDCDGGTSHAAYVARRDRSEWDRLVSAYGPNGPAKVASA